MKHAISPCLLAIPIVVLLLGVLSGCKEQPSDASKASEDIDTFSVAFYNVQNLFDNEFDGNEYPEYRPGSTNWNREMYEKKIDNVASVIAALNASIIGLCEVEDRDALNRLCIALRKKGANYPYRVIIDTPAISNTNPALLSVFPVKRYRRHDIRLPEKVSTRGILEVELAVKKRSLWLFVNHWPSKHHPESFRCAAADTLLAIISKLPSGTDYLVIGDLNADYDEFSRFTTTGHNNTGGGTGINHRLGTSLTLSPLVTRMRSEYEVISASFPVHYDAWMELPEPLRMSYVYKGNNQTPDHILLPPSMYDSVGISYIDNSFDSFTWGSRLLDHGKPAAWKTKRRSNGIYHIGEGYSDHLPILARFSVSPFVVTASSIDFSDALPDNAEPANNGWFEYHYNGWISYDNMVSYTRDTTSPATGSYSLHAVAPSHKQNYTALKTITVLPASSIKGTAVMYLRGNGSICLRTKNTSKKWQYHHIDRGTVSGRAHYSTINSLKWKKVVLTISNAPITAPVELELRCGKNVPLDIWIDG